MGKEKRFTIAADADATITYWSKQAEDVFGFDEDEAVGLHLVRRIFVRPQLVRGYGIFNTAVQGRKWEGEIDAHRRDGSDLLIWMELAPIFDDDGLVGGVMAMGEPVEASRGFDETSLKKEWLDYLIKERNLAPLTGSSYLNALERIERFADGRPFYKVEPLEMRRFLREAEYAPASKRQALAAIKSALKWMILEGYLLTSPVLQIPAPRKTQHTKRALTRAEAYTLLEACKRPNEFRVIHGGLYAGLRVAESASVTDELWVPDRMHIFGKGRKWREVPVHPKLAEVRSIILQKQPSDSTLKHICASLSHFTGIEFSSHDLRHTFGRMLREGGTDRDVIGAIYGHAGSVTTGYVPVEFPEKQAAILSLSYDPPLRVVKDAE